jgi:3-hydroxymyristoyl/3-hydroxydecanoyl-(acyl carrier protein) dehydratase
MTVDNCKFRKPVMPGDTLRIEAEALTIKTRTARFKGQCFVGDTVVCEGELMCSLVDK